MKPSFNSWVFLLTFFELINILAKKDNQMVQEKIIDLDVYKKELELSKKIDELKASDYTYEQIADMLKIPLGRVMGIC
jgi:hypothetical protein